LDLTCQESILSEDYGDFIFTYDYDFIELATNNKLCYTLIDNLYAIVYTKLSLVSPNTFHIYGYRVYPSCFGLLDNASLDASGITRVKTLPNLNLNGSGVLVAIIDTGIDYTHEAFRFLDGTSKIFRIWDQTIQTGTKPEGFYYGSEYTKEQINEALNSEDPLSVVPCTDENGHGTFLAGIACGSKNDSEDFSGVAPLSELVIVKLKPAKKFIKDFFVIPENAVCYQENDIMLAVKYVLNVASELRRPISICIGLGTSQGGHDARGALSVYLTTIASQRGVSLSIAGGNEGASGHHFRSLLTKDNEYDTVELRVGPSEPGFSMEFWGDTPSTFSIDILSPTGEYVPRIPARIGESRVINFIFEHTVINVDYQLVEGQTGDQLILVRFRNPTEGTWRFRVYSSSDLSLLYNVWLPISNFLNSETNFVRPDPDYTLTSPGNTFVPMVVTAYNPVNKTIYREASRGFTRVNEISPDFAAPGVNMIVPSLNNSYTISSGTSLAAAHITGIGAMILEWGIVNNNYPNIDSVEIRNLLIRGAKRDPNTVYPNRTWGYGIVDVYNTFNSLRGEQIL
jgi:subtilisin family serine protease